MRCGQAHADHVIVAGGVLGQVAQFARSGAGLAVGNDDVSTIAAAACKSSARSVAGIKAGVADPVR